jgi:hypothetical protein
MKKPCILCVLVAVLSLSSMAQQRIFDWTKANDEAVQLDPSDYHTGRVYHPAPEGGNIHVGIQARQPITIALTWSDQWTAALQHPEAIRQLEWLCMREHVVSTVYECHLPSDRPTVLVIHDERTPNRAMITGISVILGHGARQFISPNDLAITYYRWDCVENCIQAEYQWFRLVKEKYELTSTPKVYSLLTPERDGQPLTLKVKAPVPMTIAVVPSQLADKVYDEPGTLGEALSKTNCKQRGVQSMSFDCTLNLADGPQSLVVVPSSNYSGHKKAEIELQAVKCIANCNLMNPHEERLNPRP